MAEFTTKLEYLLSGHHAVDDPLQRFLDGRKCSFIKSMLLKKMSHNKKSCGSL